MKKVINREAIFKSKVIFKSRAIFKSKAIFKSRADLTFSNYPPPAFFSGKKYYLLTLRLA